MFVRWLVILAAALFVTIGPAAIAAAQADEGPQKPLTADYRSSDLDPERVQALARELASQSSIQNELPNGEIPLPNIPPYLAAILEFIGNYIEIIGWVVFVVFILAVIALLYFMFGDMSFGRFGLSLKHKGVVEDLSEEGAEEPLWSRDALARADELAKRGAFAEAVHILLLGSFGELKEKRTASLPPALTSREIIQRINMPQRAKEALSLIIGSVEISHFGGQSIGKAVFIACRDAYLQFAEPGNG